MSEATLILAVASLADALSAHIRGDEDRALQKLAQVDKTLEKAAEQAGQAREVVVHVHDGEDQAAEATARHAAALRSLELTRRGASSGVVYRPRRRD